MNRFNDQTGTKRTQPDERFAARVRRWLPLDSHQTVVLDPARWSDRDRQVAYWCVCEAWLRVRRAH